MGDDDDPFARCQRKRRTSLVWPLPLRWVLCIRCGGVWSRRALMGMGSNLSNLWIDIELFNHDFMGSNGDSMEIMWDTAIRAIRKYHMFGWSYDPETWIFLGWFMALGLKHQWRFIINSMRAGKPLLIENDEHLFLVLSTGSTINIWNLWWFFLWM